MKRTILFFSMLAFAGATLAAEIGVIAQFNNRLPAFNKLKGLRIATGDVNGDGIDDIAVVQGCSLKVFDPVARNLLWEYAFEDTPGLCENGVLTEGTEVNLIGFVNFEGGGLWNDVTAIISVELDGGNKIIAILIGVASKETVYLAEERIVSVLELPNGKPAIVTFIEQENIFKIVGEVGGNTTSVAGDDDLSRAQHYPVHASYDLVEKYQAEPGLRLAYEPELFDPEGDTDINGDGRMDVSMLIQGTNNQIIGMVVRGGENLGILWQFPFPDEHRANLLKGFHGFVDANGDGEKEAIFGENLAVTLDGTVHTIAENFVILDLNDIDNDGFEEIIGLNTMDSTVVVYGAMTATSVENHDPSEISFQLFQNYPNPFNPETTIAYSLQKPGEVKVTIFDVLGRKVRTLLQGSKAAGHHTARWDGRNDAGTIVSSGSYFYQLTSGESVLIRRMLVLR